MKLSVIIVNYNVEFYLEQCLLSVQKALKGIASEIWVVDNNSVDHSLKMLNDKFQDVRLIANKVNVGFSVANNQAIREANGDYVVLLNPDTIVEEDVFRNTLAYMDANPETGGLGVKMLDGKGNFLAESKRGLPTPQVAFYKIFGLAKIFPKSKIFGRYHLGYLDREKVHEVDVLAGAFMLMPRKVLDQIGLLDERFFMYGEDIDLSYRIIKAGYKNIYYPKASIIHFKGESTKKSSANYVFIFYRAMVLFAQKHFSNRHAKLFSFLINSAIYGRAGIAIAIRAIRSAYLPLLDILFLFAGVYFIQEYWGKTYLNEDAYPWYYIAYVLPIYTFIWIISALLSGAYDRPYSAWKSIKGIGLGTLVILVFYALLPESLRFSRAIILFSTIWGMFSLGMIRGVFSFLKISDFTQEIPGKKRIAILGEFGEAKRVAELLRTTPYPPGFIGVINSKISNEFQEGVIGDIAQLEDLLTIYGISELVFCSDSLKASEIIRHMTSLNSAQIAFKIAPHKSSAVIGSQSISQAEDLYMIDIDGILKPNNKRAKRIFDFFSAFILLIFSPVCLFFIKRKWTFFPNSFKVLLGINSWVGYDQSAYFSQAKLPSIKKGILFPKDTFPNRKISEEISAKLNLMYAQDYKLKNDFQILRKAFKNLGRKV